MAVDRRVVKQAPFLASPPGRQPIADAERHFDNRAVVGNRRELLVDSGSVERGQRDGRGEIVECQKQEQRPLRGGPAEGRPEGRHYVFRSAGLQAGQPRQSQRHQHTEREIHAHHRAARHARVLDERHEARERLRQRQSHVKPRNRQKWSERPDRKHGEHDLPPARLFAVAPLPSSHQQHDDGNDAEPADRFDSVEPEIRRISALTRAAVQRMKRISRERRERIDAARCAAPEISLAHVTAR